MESDNEYEPRDSRNVTGTASTPDGRWTNISGKPPMADGEPRPPHAEGENDDEPVDFEPDPELMEKIRRGLNDPA